MFDVSNVIFDSLQQHTFKFVVDCNRGASVPINPISVSSKADARAVNRDALESPGSCEGTHEINDGQKAVAESCPEISFNAIFAAFVA